MSFENNGLPTVGGPVGAPTESKRILVGIMGLIFGALGVHRFMLGDTKGGLIRIGISVVTCGVGGYVGVIEGIIYLTKSDEEFERMYVVEKKAWF
jgi:TM2 domain-containing membrane protein YozV